MQNFEVVAVEDKVLLSAIGNIPGTMSKSFIKENYQQLAFSEEELLRKKTGLLATMFPPFMRTPGAKPPAAGMGEGNRFGQLIQTSPVLLIVLYDPAKRAPASEGDFLGIISLGCMLENMWLAAADLKIGFHVVSALSSPEAEKIIQPLLKIPRHLKIAISVRLGYPQSPAKLLRVRREVGDFTHYNQYGQKGLG
jgi:nitroreductase